MPGGPASPHRLSLSPASPAAPHPPPALALQPPLRGRPAQLCKRGGGEPEPSPGAWRHESRAQCSGTCSSPWALCGTTRLAQTLSPRRHCSEPSGSPPRPRGSSDRLVLKGTRPEWRFAGWPPLRLLPVSRTSPLPTFRPAAPQPSGGAADSDSLGFKLVQSWVGSLDFAVKAASLPAGTWRRASPLQGEQRTRPDLAWPSLVLPGLSAPPRSRL